LFAVISVAAGCVLSVLSLKIHVGKSYVSEALGTVSYYGFPVWYKAMSPSISIAGGLHLYRAVFNFCFWCGVTLALLYGLRSLKKGPGY